MDVSGPVSRRSFLRAAGAFGALLAIPRGIAGAANVVGEANVAGAANAAGAAGRLGAAGVWSLARVRADTRGVEVLARSFDLTEHGRDGWFDVVLHPGDAQRLERAGFQYHTVIDDLLAHDIRERSGELRAQAANPTTRLTYRVLADYENDLRALAALRPDLVRLITLPNRSHEGRAVYGVEIAGNVAAAATDGRPTSCLLGLHHAREWPSAELPMMFAQDLVDEYSKGTPDVVELLDAIRVFIVPVVNPDGFVRSRETASDFVVPLPGAAALASEFAYHRKNMRHNSNLAAELGQGVDPNRNYPFHWAGPGAGDASNDQTYHGPGPGSEPEIANVLSLLRTSHVLTLVTNHTYSNLVLRPWGDTLANAPDEAQMKSLGDAMANINGYRSQKGIELYATTGTTEDWLYGLCGGYGYTFEIGSAGSLGLGNTTPTEAAGFHPQYNLNIPNLYALNREAYFVLLRAARDTRMHTVITGTAPPGTRVSARKSGAYRVGRLDTTAYVTEVLETSIVVGQSGRYTWHVNPSPLAETVAEVTAGRAPSSALEAYTLTGLTPDARTVTADVVALRGRSYTFNVPA